MAKSKGSLRAGASTGLGRQPHEQWRWWVLVAVLATASCRSQGPAAVGSSRAPSSPASAAAAQVTGAATPERRERSRLRVAANQAAGYLVRACYLNGRFNYRINLDPDITPRPAYNILRHAGAIHALASYQQRWPRPEVLAALLRASSYLRDRHVAPLPENGALSAVWSEDVNDSLWEAKLGGAGLALVAFQGVETVANGATDLSRQQALGAFITYLQKKDGSFYSKYFAEDEHRSDSWTSLYYPGEAALGLLLLNRRDPNSKWIATAVRAIGHLARLRQGRRHVEPDHWALLATAQLLDSWDQLGAQESVEVTRELVIDHAAQICESMLAGLPSHPLGSPLYGSFGSDGRTTPTATRLEGLMAALTFLPDRHAALRKRIRRAAEAGVGFLLRAQVTSGPHRGALPRAIGRLADQPAESPFNRRATEVRIDYVQHALSAWIQFLELPPEISR